MYYLLLRSREGSFGCSGGGGGGDGDGDGGGGSCGGVGSSIGSGVMVVVVVVKAFVKGGSCNSCRSARVNCMLCGEGDDEGCGGGGVGGGSCGVVGSTKTANATIFNTIIRIFFL